MYPHLFDICPLTMRTKGILLVRDVISILNSNSDDRKTDSSVSLWITIDSYYLQGWEKQPFDQNCATSWCEL